MAGHSKWANIQHRKGRQDAVRAKLFSKFSKEITIAAKMGDPDPEKNPRLRLAVKEAKSQSMPKDNIERAIKKAIGGDGEDYEEIRYEGYGPNGVAVIVEAMTDNRNRTASTVRSTFSKNGGNLGETGSVSFMFDRKGQVVYGPGAGDADAVMMAAIEAGAEDVESSEEGHVIWCADTDLAEVSAKLEEVIMTMLSKDAERRFDNITAVREALVMTPEVEVQETAPDSKPGLASRLPDGAGGSVVPPVTSEVSRRLGEPVPALVTLPLVVAPRTAEETVLGEAPGAPWR